MKRCCSCFGEYPDVFDVCPHCGFSVGCQSVGEGQLAPGTLLQQRYFIGPAVGTGGFGIFYRSYDQKLQRTVGIKEFFPQKLAERGADSLSAVPRTADCAEEFAYRKRKFTEEARFLSDVPDCRRFPGVTDCFEENGTSYIVMEYLSGRPLSAYVGSCDLPFALYAVTEACRGLELLHHKNRIHRDISPDNLFVCVRGAQTEIKIIDLGAAVRLGERGNARDIIRKTGFSAPEQCRGGEADKRSDIYSLGATLYTLLSAGKPPERSEEDGGRDSLPLPESVPAPVADVIRRAMAWLPSARFRDAAELRRALEKAAGRCGIGLPAREEVPGRKREIRRPRTPEEPLRDLTEVRGVSVPVPERLLPGTELRGRYTVGLGHFRAGYASVYGGRDRVLKKDVCITELFPEALAVRDYDGLSLRPLGPDGAFADCRALFLAGTAGLAACAEGACERFTDSFEANGTAYLISDAAPLFSVAEYLRLTGKKRLSADAALRILVPAAQALQRMERQGLVHGNVSPYSVWTDGERVMLRFSSQICYPGSCTDGYRFGAVRRVYTAPELIRRDCEASAETDLYSLAALAYRLLTGSEPPDGGERASCRVTTGTDPLIPPEKKKAFLSKKLAEAVSAGLSLRPEDRRLLSAYLCGL